MINYDADLLLFFNFSVWLNFWWNSFFFGFFIQIRILFFYVNSLIFPENNSRMLFLFIFLCFYKNVLLFGFSFFLILKRIIFHFLATSFVLCFLFLKPLRPFIYFLLLNRILFRLVISCLSFSAKQNILTWIFQA